MAGLSTAGSAALALALGAILGSFLNVVVHRLPHGLSVVRPASRCPGCAEPIRPRDNVPVLSWLALRGRCRSCREPIPARYPLVEAATAGLLALVVLAHGADRDAWLPAAFVVLLVPVALIDAEHRIIPNRLNALGALAALVILAVTRPEQLPAHLAWGAAAGGFFLLAALAYPAGMGMGDVKLAAVMGLFLGAAVAPAILVALLAGSLAGAAIMARRGIAAGRRTAVPFGPFLALGGLVGVLTGDAIVAWYQAAFL